MRKLYERRWELPNRELPFYEFPDNPAAVANSLFWYCSWCGTHYAEMRSWLNEVPAIWHGIAGCCPGCSGNRFMVPGSIESLYLMRFPPAQTILDYQLSVELNFLQSKDHPHNAIET